VYSNTPENPDPGYSRTEKETPCQPTSTSARSARSRSSLLGASRRMAAKQPPVLSALARRSRGAGAASSWGPLGNPSGEHFSAGKAPDFFPPLLVARMRVYGPPPRSALLCSGRPLSRPYSCRVHSLPVATPFKTRMTPIDRSIRRLHHLFRSTTSPHYSDLLPDCPHRIVPPTHAGSRTSAPCTSEYGSIRNREVDANAQSGVMSRDRARGRRFQRRDGAPWMKAVSQAAPACRSDGARRRPWWLLAGKGRAQGVPIQAPPGPGACDRRRSEGRVSLTGAGFRQD